MSKFFLTVLLNIIAGEKKTINGGKKFPEFFIYLFVCFCGCTSDNHDTLKKGKVLYVNQIQLHFCSFIMPFFPHQLLALCAL